MTSINVTRLSSKGQVVIPAEMRTDLNEGDELIIIRDENRIILKKVEKLTEEMKEDLEFAKRTEKAYQMHERGECTKMGAKDFIKEMKKW